MGFFSSISSFFSDVIKIGTFGLVDLDDVFKEPEPPAPAPKVPTRADVGAAEIARLTKRRALATGGRLSTLLVDDTETPVGQLIPPRQIGRATLLGG